MIQRNTGCAGAILTLVLLAGAPAAPAAVIRVPADQPTIQAGIDAAAEGDLVLIADGVYTGDGNRNLDFGGKAIIVRSQNGPAACMIGEDYYTWDHRGFRFHSGEDRRAVVDGFTIRRGAVNGNGGGILCLDSSPTIRNCLITGNYASGNGGGISCQDSSALIEGNTISHNSAELGAEGGGIHCQGGSPEIRGNSIGENGCGASTEYPGAGGGISCRTDGSAIIAGNTIIRNGAGIWGRGGGIFCTGGVTVTDNRIEDNEADVGGGIYLYGSPTITGNLLLGNESEGGWGGGIGNEDDECAALIQGNVIAGNLALFGGGLGLSGSPRITGNLIAFNSADYCGGGGLLGDGAMLSNCTIAVNTCLQGGGIYASGSVTVVNTIFWGNEAQTGDTGYLASSSSHASTLSIRYSDVQGGQASIYLEPGTTLEWGAGMIDADPLFLSGPDGDHYLSQIAAGQAVQSPCVDAGDPAGGTAEGTTRTDQEPDTGVADMGHHYPVPGVEPETAILTGPQGVVDSPVLVFTFSGSDEADPPATLRFSYRLDDEDWSPYGTATRAVLAGPPDGAHRFQVRARDSAGNVDSTPAEGDFYFQAWNGGQTWGPLVTAPGPGPTNPPLVRTAAAQWLAYGPVGYGANVAAGDLDGDGAAEVLTGPGPGAAFGPHVRGWTPGGAPLDLVGFLAYGTHKYGVNVACGDLDGDGFDEIVTGAGLGAVFGPHVRGWNCDGGAASAMAGVSFMAYGTHRFGVNVACGDLEGDGFDEIVTGAGPGAVFGPHVRGWNVDGGTAAPLSAVSFLAYGSHRFGVNVACGDLDGDGLDELVTGPGPSEQFGAHVRGWNYDGAAVAPMPEVSYFAYASRFGAVVAAGDVDGDGIDEILTMPGPDPLAGAHLRAWNVDGGPVTPLAAYDFTAYDAWITRGGRVAVVVGD